MGLAATVLASPDEPKSKDPKAKAAAPKKVVKKRFHVELAPGRFTGSNSVSYTVRTTETQGDREETSTHFAQHTERFVDDIVRANRNGDFEMRRNYLRLYTKSRDSLRGRPNVSRSPLQGRTLTVRETQRRRHVVLKGAGVVSNQLKRVVGMEIDWRDIFLSEPIGVGDEWKPEVTRLARRMAAYLDCGNRSKMNVRYEENVVVNGSRQAKFYVDWTLEGMRGRKLHTSVNLAGDVFYDFALKRIVAVDLGGAITVRGVFLDDKQPRVIKGHGPVTLKTTLSRAPVKAAVEDEDDDADADADETED